MNCDQQSAVMLQVSPYHKYKETDHDSLYALAIFTNRTQATSVIDSLHSCTANLLCSGAHTCTFIQLGICYLQDHSQLYSTCILKHLQSKM